MRCLQLHPMDVKSRMARPDTPYGVGLRRTGRSELGAAHTSFASIERTASCPPCECQSVGRWTAVHTMVVVLSQGARAKAPRRKQWDLSHHSRKSVNDPAQDMALCILETAQWLCSVENHAHPGPPAIRSKAVADTDPPWWLNHPPLPTSMDGSDDDPRGVGRGLKHNCKGKRGV